MIKIIKDKSKELKMKCIHCDSSFTYGLSDLDNQIVKHDDKGEVMTIDHIVIKNEHYNMVDCPVCGCWCNHADRIRED